VVKEGWKQLGVWRGQTGWNFRKLGKIKEEGKSKGSYDQVTKRFCKGASGPGGKRQGRILPARIGAAS